MTTTPTPLIRLPTLACWVGALFAESTLCHLQNLHLAVIFQLGISTDLLMAESDNVGEVFDGGLLSGSDVFNGASELF
jgi:hypothetical protein